MPVVLNEPTTCVLLVFQAIISFRSVPRVLGILGSAGQWVPHFTSVINWTLRVGLSRLQVIGKIKEPWIAIVDCSIDIGMKKALVVLRVRLDAMMNKNAGLSLADCECVGVEVAERWNGALVASTLENVFEKAGAPTAILKDDGGDLQLGATIYANKQKLKLHSIRDVGHYTANSIKSQFGNTGQFLEIISLVSRLSSQIKHSSFGYLMAPNLGNHSRFLRITKTAQWCLQMLELWQNKKIPTEKFSRKLKGNFTKLFRMTGFLKRFCKACAQCDDLMLLLKRQGLNEETYTKANSIIACLPKRSSIRTRTQNWLNEHIAIHRVLCLGQTPLPVSSDIIETLFGKFKNIMQRCPRAEFNRLILIFPCLCGDLNATHIAAGLSDVSHYQLKNWERDYVSETIRQARKRAFL